MTVTNWESKKDEKWVEGKEVQLALIPVEMTVARTDTQKAFAKVVCLGTLWAPR